MGRWPAFGITVAGQRGVHRLGVGVVVQQAGLVQSVYELLDLLLGYVNARPQQQRGLQPRRVPRAVRQREERGHALRQQDGPLRNPQRVVKVDEGLALVLDAPGLDMPKPGPVIGGGQAALRPRTALRQPIESANLPCPDSKRQ